MSDQHESETFIKTPRQLAWIVFLAFAVPITIAILLVKFSGLSTQTGLGADVSSPQAIESRIRPVASFELGAAQEEGGAARSGEAVYTAQCAACHGTGVSGAPKFQDKGDWEPRLGQGFDALVHSAVGGKGAMPPQTSTATELEVARAVAYMANAAGGSFEEPADESESGSEEKPAEEAKAAEPQQAPQAEEKASEKAEAPAAAPAPAAAAAPAAEEKAAPAADLAAGKKLFDSTCMVCHATGVAGAPKVGNKDQWAPLIASGMDTMVGIAIKGKGAMPPRGGRADVSDQDIRNAVAYMVSKSE